MGRRHRPGVPSPANNYRVFTPIAGNFNLNISVADSLSPPNTTTGTVTLKIYQVGDANVDDIVSISDATYVERVILGLTRQTPGCDANLDGSVTIADVTRIERIILGLN
jgi:hypothetical protein